MNVETLLAAVVMGLAIILFFAGLAIKLSKDELEVRLDRFGNNQPQPVETGPREAPSPRELLRVFGNLLSPMMARSSRSSKLVEDLAKADIKMRPSEWLLTMIFLGVVVGLLLSLRFGSFVMVPIALVGSYFGMGFYLKFRQARRRRAFNRQLGETITLLSNALKAGYSFAQALSTVSKSANPPIADEFARASREIALGVSVDESLNHMVARNESEDFDLLVTAVQIQRVVGGNLAEILDTIAFTIRERVRIQGEIRTLTAQARMSGYIITGLPIALGLLLSVISPSYFSPMVHQIMGEILLGVAAVMMFAGYMIMSKVTKIEV